MTTRSLIRGLTLAVALVAAPLAASAADGFARTSGTLRAGAGVDYPAVASVSRGEGLAIYGCTRGYLWCDVSASGERGWFPGRRIEFLRDGRRVGLYQVAPVIGISIVAFSMTNYWGTYYAGRPWYNERRWWRNHGHNPPRLTGQQLSHPMVGPTPAHVTPRVGVTKPPVRAHRTVVTPRKPAPRHVVNPGMQRKAVTGQRSRAVQQQRMPRSQPRLVPNAGGNSGR